MVTERRSVVARGWGLENESREVWEERSRKGQEEILLVLIILILAIVSQTYP